MTISFVTSITASKPGSYDTGHVDINNVSASYEIPSTLVVFYGTILSFTLILTMSQLSHSTAIVYVTNWVMPNIQYSC